MTGRSTPAKGGVTDDPIRIGTLLYTPVEPQRGHRVDYNRWWRALSAGQRTAVPDSGVGRILWASPFIGSVPGTDAYRDQLWSTPAP